MVRVEVVYCIAINCLLNASCILNATKTVLPALNTNDAMRKAMLHVTLLLLLLLQLLLLLLWGSWENSKLWHLQTGNIASRPHSEFDVVFASFRVVTDTNKQEKWEREAWHEMSRDARNLVPQLGFVFIVVVFPTSCCCCCCCLRPKPFYATDTFARTQVHILTHSHTHSNLHIIYIHTHTYIRVLQKF